MVDNHIHVAQRFYRLAYYGLRSMLGQMIKSWANSAMRRFVEQGKSRFEGLDGDSAMELLAMLDAASALNDLSPLKSIGLHKLSGKRKGQWAMTINGPWRICFRFSKGDAWEVEIVDYH